MSHKLLIIGFLLPTIIFSAWAVEYPLPDLADEVRAYTMFHRVSCNFCGGKSIADSPADIADEMRRVVRERIAAGDTDFAIMGYLASRFSGVILLPPEPLHNITPAIH